MTHRRRKLLITLGAIAVLLLALRLALPGWLLERINERMARMGDYQGHVEDIDLFLWAGEYTLDAVTIEKRTHDIPVPFFEAERIDVSISWDALLHGAVVAEATLHDPVLNFVDDEQGATQTGVGVPWRRKLEELSPIRIDEIRIRNGTVHFRNFNSDPPVDLQARRVEGRVLNLTNIRDEADRSAEYALTADMFGESPLELDGSADPFHLTQDFQFQLRVRSVDLTNLNEFLQAYANLDVASGSGTFVMELEAEGGQLTGYAKPLFTDVDIFSWKQDIERQRDNPIRALWEAITGGIENLLKNQGENQFATRVEVNGRIDNPETSTIQAIVGVLKNAFVEAYRPRFEGLPTRNGDAD